MSGVSHYDATTTHSISGAWRRAQEAREIASMHRADLAATLAEAQADGYSVRQLAELLDVSVTTVQRLIAAAKS